MPVVRKPGSGVDGPGAAAVVWCGVEHPGRLHGTGRPIEAQEVQLAGEDLSRALCVADRCAIRRPGGLGIEAVRRDGIAVVRKVGRPRCFRRQRVSPAVDLRGGNSVLVAAIRANHVEFIEAVATGLEEDPITMRIPEGVVVGGAPRIAGARWVVGQALGFAARGRHRPDVALADEREGPSVRRPAGL